MSTTAQPGTCLRLAFAGILFTPIAGCDLHEPVHGTEPDSGTDAAIDPETDSGADPGCKDGQAQYASLEACMADGSACEQVGQVWCGGPLVHCCQAEPSCDANQESFLDQASCDALWSGCEVRSVCCASIVCGPAGSALTTEVTFADEIVSLHFENASVYTIDCTDGVKLLKPGPGGEWVPLHDVRPWQTNGPFYLDGVYHEHVQEHEACGVKACEPLADQSLLREEYVLFEGDPHPGVPDLVTQIYQGPLRVQVELYAEETCSGGAPTLTRTFDVEAP